MDILKRTIKVRKFCLYSNVFDSAVLLLVNESVVSDVTCDAM